LAENPSVTFFWENRGHYSQVLYVGNINIYDNISVGNKAIAASETTSILAFPNPNNGNFSLLWKNCTFNEMEVRIVDRTGKQIKYEMIAAPNKKNVQKKISLCNIAAGLYLLEAKPEKQTWNLKLAVKQHLY